MCRKQDDENRTFEEKIDDNQTFEEWVDDKRTFWKKFEDLFYNKPWRMILYSFLASLVLFLVSWLIRNKGGIFVVFTYPISLIVYGLSILAEKYGHKTLARRWNPLRSVTFVWIAPFVLFILHFLGVEF